jgi:hypothetical protein
MYTCNRLLLCEGLNCSTDAGIDTFVSLCQHVSKHIFGKNNCADRIFYFSKTRAKSLAQSINEWNRLQENKSKIAYGSALPVLNHSNDVHLQEPKHLRQSYLRLEC